MIRVAYLTHEFDCKNGSTMSLLNMIHALSEDVEPLVIFPKEGPTVELFRNRGVKCEIVPFLTHHIHNDWKLPFRKLKYRLIDKKINRTSEKILTDLLIQNSVDIVHSNTSVIGLGYKVATKLKIPHIWHIREFIDEDLSCQPLYGFKNLIHNLHNTNATISITKVIRSHFHLNGLVNAYQVYNAIIDTPNKIINYDKEKFFMLAGRLTREKGVEEAIEAFYLFNKRTREQYRLKLIGSVSPNYEIDLRKKIVELDLRDKIEILKYTDNLPDYYRKATGFLMASKKEGLGRVTIEAMNYGCPVIGYNAGGTSELIFHAENGLLYNTVEECADMMKSITDPMLRKKIIKNAKKYSENKFTEKVYRKQLIEIYNKVIKNGAKTSNRNISTTISSVSRK